MDVVAIILTTIIVFVVVDLLLRMVLTKVREARTRRERESALDTGLATPDDIVSPENQIAFSDKRYPVAARTVVVFEAF